MTTIEVTLGRWANRETLSYGPPNSPVDGKCIDAYGNIQGSKWFHDGISRKAYKIDSGSGVTYIMYEDDTEQDVAIFKITEG